MMARWAAAVSLMVFSIGSAAAAEASFALHGIGLGMTIDQIFQSTTLACRRNETGDMACVDTADDSQYSALMSGGQPSVALTVTHLFCSAKPATALLHQTLQGFGLKDGDAHPDPNGAHFDLGPASEGIFVSNAAPCKTGGQAYQVLIRDDKLIQLKAAKAGKAAK